jgi:hypothetical protein
MLVKKYNKKHKFNNKKHEKYKCFLCIINHLVEFLKFYLKMLKIVTKKPKKKYFFVTKIIFDKMFKYFKYAYSENHKNMSYTVCYYYFLLI